MGGEEYEGARRCVVDIIAGCETTDPLVIFFSLADPEIGKMGGGL